MRWGFSASRRADEFDALLERGPDADTATTDTATEDDARLLTLVTAMRSVPEVQARPEFVADLRAQLMAEAETALAPTALTPADLSRLELPARHTRRERRIAALVAGVAIAGATTSVAVAAQSALPGESLYPIKRVIESAHTGVSLGDAGRGSTLLGSASSRLSEAAELTDRGESGDRVAQTLGTFVDQTTQGADLLLADYEQTGRESSITRLRTFAADGLADLEALEPIVAYDARDELLAAAALLARIDADASERCPACNTVPAAVLPQALAGVQISLPTPTPISSDDAVDDRRGGSRAGPTGPDLPDVDPSDVGPGSVADPTPGLTIGQDGPTLTNPLKGLTDGLKGGDSPATAPRVPVVSDVVDGVGQILQGVLEPILDPITGQLLGTSDEDDQADDDSGKRR